MMIPNTVIVGALSLLVGVTLGQSNVCAECGRRLREKK